MKPTPKALDAIPTMTAKVFVVALLVGGLGGYAGPIAINAHDNLMLAVGVLCFIGAGLALILGGFWIAASVRTVFDHRNIKP